MTGIEIIREDCANALALATPSLKRMAGERLMITGAAGFVGSYLMDFFAYANTHYFDKPVKVVGVDNWIAASRHPIVDENILLVKDDASCWEQCQYIIHAASIAAPKFYLNRPLETLEANVEMTRRLLRRLQSGARDFLYMSSVEVYGNPEVVPTPETYLGNTAFTTPRAVYDESKRYAELLCSVYHRKFGVNVKVARPFNIYGPGERLDDGRLVPQLMRSLRERVPLTVYGDGSSTRSLLYISDAIVQLLAILLDGKPGEAYNVGDEDCEISIGQFAAQAAAMFPELKVEFVPSHETLAGAPVRRRPAMAKTMTLAPYPSVNLIQGIQRTCWYYAGV